MKFLPSEKFRFGWESLIWVEAEAVAFQSYSFRFRFQRQSTASTASASSFRFRFHIPGYNPCKSTCMSPVFSLDSNECGPPKTQGRTARPAKDPRTHCAARDQKSLPTPVLEYNIFIFCHTKTETARLRFFMVGNFVLSNWIIPDTKEVIFIKMTAFWWE